MNIQDESHQSCAPMREGPRVLICSRMQLQMTLRIQTGLFELSLKILRRFYVEIYIFVCSVSALQVIHRKGWR